jgi:uncharacterized membrane protein YwzB
MKKMYYFFFTLELIGIGGFFGKIIYYGIQSIQGNAVGDMSKDTMVLLAVLFVVGFVGFLVSNKLVDKLNQTEDTAI